MGREIKFRAWDHENKKMVDVYAIDWAGDTHRPTSINYPQGKLYDAPEDFGGAIKLMQSTGLKDKNGVDIYEGDILANSKRKPRLVRTVAWTEGREPGGAPCWTGWEMDQVEASCWIVIGNIYENPDLLERAA